MTIDPLAALSSDLALLMGNVADTLFLSLPVAATGLLVGVRGSGRRQAGIPAGLAGILSLFTLPGIAWSLGRLQML
jgi:hypothetical protein